MKVLVSVVALLFAGAAHADALAQSAPSQTPPPAPARPASDLTRDLNSGPPVPAVYLAPAPTPAPPPVVTTAPPPSPTLAPAPAGVPPPVSSARTTPVPPPSEPFIPPPGTAPARITPIPTAPAPQPRMTPITPPGAVAVPRTEPLPARPAPAPTATPEPVPAPPPQPPNVSTVTVLDAGARAALPFTADLPSGFEIVTGRPGPDFRIYTIRRGERSFVMVYAGPASQFPIYSGEMVEAGGRASVVSTEDGVRHAMEHLFQRAAAPLEVHVWTMSLEGADRAMAERIAQSVDVR